MAKGTVAWLQIGLRHAIDVRHRYRLDAVTIEEEQAPVALGNRLRQRNAQPSRIVDGFLEIVEQG